MNAIEKSPTIAALAAAHSSLMGEIRDPVKDTTGYGYKYATLDQLLEISRPILAVNSLSVIQDARFLAWPADSVIDLPEVKGFKPKLIGQVTVHTILAHSSGEYLVSETSLPVETMKGMSLAQAVGSAITYARRYALAAVLGMAQVDVDAAHDGVPAMPEPHRAPPPRPAARPAMPPRPAAQESTQTCIDPAIAADIEMRVISLGRDPMRFAQTVGGVSSIKLIPLSEQARALEVIAKAEKKGMTH